MQLLIMKHRLALTIAGTVAVLSAILGAGLTAIAAAATPPPQPTLASVSSARLAQAGIQLQAPTSSAAVSKEKAQQAAQSAIPGSTAREAVLADFSNTHHVAPSHELAWAVSLTVPPGFLASAGPPPGHAVKPSYLVVFINAKTGEFIQGTFGS